MLKTYSSGTIEVITGPMFSGKSEELIKRVKMLGHAKINTLVVKPSVDDRWEKEQVISRSGSTIKTQVVKNASEITKIFQEGRYEALAIDEVQFFDDEVVDVIVNLANQGVRVIVSGLDQDFLGKPFKMVPQILAVADLVDKQQAVCNVCHKAASMSYRKNSNKSQIAVGDHEYEPRCRKCHHQGMKDQGIS